MDLKFDSNCLFCNLLLEGFPLKVADLDVSIVCLHVDQYFYGRCLVILKCHEVELYNLTRDDRIRFFEDMIRVANALNVALNPDKINYAVLGNVVPHLHWHVIPRYKSDSLWGKPIWAERHEERRLSQLEYEQLINLIRKYI